MSWHLHHFQRVIAPIELTKENMIKTKADRKERKMEKIGKRREMRERERERERERLVPHQGMVLLPPEIP